MTNTQARAALHRVCASFMVATDGVGAARRGWFITRGAKLRCWLGATALEAVENLLWKERQIAGLVECACLECCAGRPDGCTTITRVRQ